MVDPKIGFAVICRCREGQQALEVLSVRRDQSSHAPGKWSFPGGKLAAGEESEEKRVLAKVETQCAGGDPLGLPPLIHIIRLYNESSTRGKVQQTIYHVFALDVEKDTTWCSWQPGVTEGSNSDVDTSQVDIVYRENSVVGRVCGHLWLDLDMLISMCSNQPGPSSISIDSKGGTLHLGLVKWIQNHGNTVMKLLMSRSPKLHHSKSGQSSGGNSSPSRVHSKESLQDHPAPPPPPPPPPSLPPQGVYNLMPQFMYPPAYGPAVFSPASFMHYPMPTTIGMGVPSRPGLLALPVGPMQQAPQHHIPATPVKQEVAASSSLPVTVIANTAQHSYHTPVQPHPVQFRQPFAARSHIICQYYLKGSCKFGTGCRYLHPPLTAVPSSPQLPDQAVPHLVQLNPHQPPISAPPQVPPVVAAPPPQATEHQDSAQVQLYSHGTQTQPLHVQPSTPSVAPNSAQQAVGLKFRLICQLDTKNVEASPSAAPMTHFAAVGQDLYLSSNSQVHNYRILFNETTNTTALHPEQAYRFVATFDLSWDHAGARTTNDAVSYICCPCVEGVVWLGTSQGSIVRHDFSLKRTARVLNGQNEPEISALVHFASRERGEYVIGGNDSGMLFWYVQSARQKGFNLLLTERRHYSRVTGLETMAGNKLLSCSRDGHVCFWNTTGQIPVTVGEFRLFEGTPHSLSRLLVMKKQHIFVTFTTLDGDLSKATVPSRMSPMVWRYSNPPERLAGLEGCTDEVCCTSTVHLSSGTGSLVALGMKNGVVKVYSVPHFVLTAELIFAEMDGCDCCEISATLVSADLLWNSPLVQLTDVLIATLWSNGVAKVCRASDQA